MQSQVDQVQKLQRFKALSPKRFLKPIWRMVRYFDILELLLRVKERYNLSFGSQNILFVLNWQKSFCGKIKVFVLSNHI